MSEFAKIIKNMNTFDALYELDVFLDRLALTDDIYYEIGLDIINKK
tara:strand:+ start:1068 stop:1205 length:138 start_codon:yes stop_codon:yes gene_type:complete